MGARPRGAHPPPEGRPRRQLALPCARALPLRRAVPPRHLGLQARQACFRAWTGGARGPPAEQDAVCGQRRLVRAWGRSAGQKRSRTRTPPRSSDGARRPQMAPARSLAVAALALMGSASVVAAARVSAATPSSPKLPALGQQFTLALREYDDTANGTLSVQETVALDTTNRRSHIVALVAHRGAAGGYLEEVMRCDKGASSYAVALGSSDPSQECAGGCQNSTLDDCQFSPDFWGVPSNASYVGPAEVEGVKTERWTFWSMSERYEMDFAANATSEPLRFGKVRCHCGAPMTTLPDRSECQIDANRETLKNVLDERLQICITPWPLGGQGHPHTQRLHSPSARHALTS